MSSYPKWVYHKTAGGQIVPDKEAHDALPPGWYGTPDEAAASPDAPETPAVAQAPETSDEAWPTAPDTETEETATKTRNAKGHFEKRK